MRRTILSLFAATLCLGLFHTSASAETIKQQQRQQRARIRQGVRSGELTAQEARRLANEQAKIRKDERRARKNGIDVKERRRLQKELKRANRDIRRQKHDKQQR